MSTPSEDLRKLAKRMDDWARNPATHEAWEAVFCDSRDSLVHVAEWLEGCERIPYLPPEDREALRWFVKVRDMADGRVATVTHQGQAMDGYSELAEYRSLVEKVRAILARLEVKP